MNPDQMLQIAIAYAQRNTTAVLVGAAILLLLTLVKPKSMLKLYGAGLLLLIGLYLLTLFGEVISSGTSQKNRMIYKTSEANDQ